MTATDDALEALRAAAYAVANAASDVAATLAPNRELTETATALVALGEALRRFGLTVAELPRYLTDSRTADTEGRPWWLS